MFLLILIGTISERLESRKRPNLKPSGKQV